jgi:endonuclease/exonuclease/phosphatase family metal-dependent hydrolase
MRLMTANIRFSGAQDGENAWENRKDFCAELIGKLSPDIIGFQELCEDQFEFMQEALDSYDSYGIFSRPAGKNPQNRIFYTKEKFKLISSSGFYLSETPHIPESISWDNSNCTRTANWVQLEEISSGKEFRFINTHLDHIGEQARIEQARLVSENANAYPDEFPQFLTGDMNCDADNQAIKTYLANGWKDTFNEIHGTLKPGLTYHAYKGEDFTGDHITPGHVNKMDWIFYKGAVSVRNAEIIKETKNGKHHSDHYWVIADIELKG